MRKVTSEDIRESNVFKYYRVVRRWASKNYKIPEPDIENLIYLYCEKRFTKKAFKKGEYLLAWDSRRWKRYVENEWVEVWREKNNYTQKYNIYKTSQKVNNIINRIYRILLGEEDIPITLKSPFYKNETYTDKVMNKAIDWMYRDENRKQE